MLWMGVVQWVPKSAERLSASQPLQVRPSTSRWPGSAAHLDQRTLPESVLPAGKVVSEVSLQRLGRALPTPAFVVTEENNRAERILLGEPRAS